MEEGAAYVHVNQEMQNLLPLFNRLYINISFLKTHLTCNDNFRHFNLHWLPWAMFNEEIRRSPKIGRVCLFHPRVVTIAKTLADSRLVNVIKWRRPRNVVVHQLILHWMLPNKKNLTRRLMKLNQRFVI